MQRIIVYRNKDCARCRRFAHAGQFFDWLNRIEASTAVPPTGPLKMGEIVVEDLQTGEFLHGVNAVRKIFHQIPVYMLFLPLLRIPAIARYVDKETRGCSGNSCEVKSEFGNRKSELSTKN
jgi:hypothetical protein